MNYKIKEPILKYNKNDSIIDKILKIRGIKNKEEFINPPSSCLHSPFELSNMKEACMKILKAIYDKKVIGLFADIDCDGVSSTAVMYKYLKQIGGNIKILYHQRKDNHGIKLSDVDKDVELLLIVDSSTNSVEECKEISKRMDIVILDHHESDIENPYATIVNPQLNNYPNKALSGSGVCYKTCQAIDEILKTNYSYSVLDVAIIGLIGDMMDVSELETRYLILHGLYKINNKNKCDKNLKLILKALKKDSNINSTTISFYIAPLINSIIRLNKIEDAIFIFINDNEKDVKDKIKECIKLNDKRKEIQKDIVNKLKEEIDNTNKAIVHIVNSDNGEKTLLGLVANNLMGIYKKPIILVSKNKEDGLLYGSARNNSATNIKEIINNSKLCEAQGHEGSFGVIGLSEENINKLVELLNNSITDKVGDIRTEVDLELKESEITMEQLEELEKLDMVVGQGFKEPQFLIKGLFKTDCKVMKDIHVKLLTQTLDCLKFNLEKDEVDKLTNCFAFDVIGGLSINSWYNFKTKKTIKTKQILINDINIY